MGVVSSEERISTTTRRHPRTLAEAFPDERAHATEGWQRGGLDLVGPLLGFLAAMLAGGLLALYVIGKVFGS
jgi:hypothetical protein